MNEVVMCQLQVERTRKKVHWSKTNVLPLCHATNQQFSQFCISIQCIKRFCQKDDHNLHAQIISH